MANDTLNTNPKSYLHVPPTSEKTNSGLNIILTEHSSIALSDRKDTHPVDIITQAMESEGIKLLLSMLHKEELETLCDFLSLKVEAESPRKKDMINLIRLTWLEYGTKKFLKKKVNDTTLALLCKHLNLSTGPIHLQKSHCIEQIVKHINILGLENFSKKVHDENIKALAADLTREGKSPQGTVEMKMKKHKDMIGLWAGNNSAGLSPGGGGGSSSLHKSQEIKRAKVHNNGKSVDKEKSPRKNGRKKS